MYKIDLNLYNIFSLLIFILNTSMFCVLIILILTGCSPLTSINHEKKTGYKPKYNFFDSPIAQPYEQELRSNQDGGIVIDDGRSALLHRLALVRMAKHSIDIQTYIYKNELTSSLIMHELLRAADRGVKIRILIDDNGISSDFYDIIILDKHENIQVRIFNPYFFRFGLFRPFEALFDFNRINKRMHNKLFVFDESALIVGGRNIGDEYFDSGSVNFTDIDLLFIGNIAKDAKLNFEHFWNYKRSIPANLFPSKGKMKRYDKRMQDSKWIAKKYNVNIMDWEEYNADIEEFKEKYVNKKFTMHWGDGIFLADLPQKIDLDISEIKTPILDTLVYNLNMAKDSIIICSSYLVPGDGVVDLWNTFVKKGVEIKILTNSLASIDVVPVYSHWEKYRDKLALMGMSVYEYPNFDSNKAKLKGKAKVYNSPKGRVSLHSKSMVIDDNIVAVGSFNLDYRSAIFNTESIVFFKSRELALELKRVTDSQINDSYKIFCDSKTKKCSWILKNDEVGEQIFKSPPNTSLWLRIYKNLAKIMPEKLF